MKLLTHFPTFLLTIWINFHFSFVIYCQCIKISENLSEIGIKNISSKYFVNYFTYLELQGNLINCCEILSPWKFIVFLAYNYSKFQFQQFHIILLVEHILDFLIISLCCFDLKIFSHNFSVITDNFAVERILKYSSFAFIVKSR